MITSIKFEISLSNHRTVFLFSRLRILPLIISYCTLQTLRYFRKRLYIVAIDDQRSCNFCSPIFYEQPASDFGPTIRSFLRKGQDLYQPDRLVRNITISEDGLQRIADVSASRFSISQRCRNPLAAIKSPSVAARFDSQETRPVT